MNIAVLGGSFNPIHYGHLILAETILQKMDYDVVLFIPTAQSPLKDATGGASPQDRLDMLLAAVSGQRRFVVDDCELRRGGLSYTIDTLAEIQERYQIENKIGLILGDDLVGAFHKWKSVDQILHRADLLVASRNFSELADFPFPFIPVPNPQIQLSSSQIREAIKKKLPWKHLVPAGTAAIIEDRGLYIDDHGDNRTFSTSLISLIEDTARTWLPEGRFLHSKNVAVLSAQLCGRFGCDERQGYLAGIAHDLCKHLPTEQIVSLVQWDRMQISEIEKKKPELMHGRAAAVLLREYYGLLDESILEAIRMHTFGGPSMGSLAKIVYIADKIEPSRDGIRPELKRACRTDPLSILFGKVVADTLRFLKQKGKVLNTETDLLLTELKREGLL